MITRDEAVWLARHGSQQGWEDFDASVRGFDINDPRVFSEIANDLSLGLVLDARLYCLYCNARLVVANTQRLRLRDDAGVWWSYQANRCPGCGWWLVTNRIDVSGAYGFSHTSKHAYGVLRRFDVDHLNVPLSLMREFFARNPHTMARFDPYRFEDVMTDCLRDVYGNAEVVKIGGRRDRGIDIKAIHADGETTLIQVKRRSDFSKPEGVTVVRELHGVMLREGVTRGMVLSTGGDYTKDAREEVEQVGRRLRRYSMELMSLKDVIDLLDAPRFASVEPWSEFGIRFDEPEPDWPVTEDVIEPAAFADARSERRRMEERWGWVGPKSPTVPTTAQTQLTWASRGYRATHHAPKQ